MADINLVAWVNIVCFTDIDYYGHAGVRFSQGHRLRSRSSAHSLSLAQPWPVANWQVARNRKGSRVHPRPRASFGIIAGKSVR